MIDESLRFAGIFPLFFYKDRSRPPVHALGDVQEKRKKMGWAVRGGGFSPDETFASTLSELQQFVRKNPLSTFLLYSA